MAFKNSLNGDFKLGVIRSLLTKWDDPPSMLQDGPQKPSQREVGLFHSTHRGEITYRKTH